MGETISKLVFRPPTPATKIKADNFFYLDLVSPTIGDIISCTSSYSCAGTNSFEEEEDDSTADGPYRIPAFFLLRRGAKITILYSHGNAEDLGMMYRRMKDIARSLCVNVMAYDYPGYGLSQPHCKPSEKLCYRAIETAHSYLLNAMKIPPSRIVLYGRSLGSGPSCYMAKKASAEGRPVGGLILHSPFLSIYRIVIDSNSLGIIGDMFQSYKRAKDIKCPVLVIHGYEDKVVPFWHGLELLRSFSPEFRAKPYFVENMGHNNIESRCREDYVSHLSTFLQKYVVDGPKPIPQHERFLHSSEADNVEKSTLNPTWLEHGMSIVNNAINSTDKDVNKYAEHGSRRDVSTPSGADEMLKELNRRLELMNGIDTFQFIQTEENWGIETEKDDLFSDDIVHIHSCDTMGS